jgi:alpha-tubulin suppressor-like RCC1 family protein
LLFTYGLNNHGQLGIGIKSQIKDGNRGFTTTPILITPLLENGGKAINCAAGVDHSLVVVATEGRRVQKGYTNPNVAYSGNGAIQLSRVTSSPCRISTDSPDDGEDLLSGSTNNESVQHHQLYGFGSNDFMKLGLVSATVSEDGQDGDGQEDTLLPHRVALHCTIWPQKGSSSSYPPQGIFDIAASAEHSAALVRRATGAIEVYTWGNATLGALGLPMTQDPSDPSVKIQGSPTRKPPSNANNIFPLPTVLESLSHRPNGDSPFPREISLGPYCSFVVMSNGRCYSFGFSAEGMLGQGVGITHSMDPKQVFLPPSERQKVNGIVSVSAGAFHAIAIDESGHAFSWGINSDDRLGLGTDEFGKLTSTPSEEKKEIQVVEWFPQYVDVQEHTSLSCQATAAEDSTRVVRACAGYDASLLVMRSGQVLSFGKRSGRLGKGEVASNVAVPKPMFGGLRLFHNNNNKSRRQRRSAAANASS